MMVFGETNIVKALNSLLDWFMFIFSFPVFTCQIDFLIDGFNGEGHFMPKPVALFK